MREFISSIVGAATLGLFVSLFVLVMNNSQSASGDQAGLMWFWAILLIAVFLTIMGLWHSWFAPKEDRGAPPPH